MALITWSRSSQDSGVTTTRAATQLNPALCVSIADMFIPWNSMSFSDHGPGMTITGVTLPSSAVNGLCMIGSSAALRAAPSSPVPYTIIS